MLDAKDEENSEGMCNYDHEAASPYTIHTAVLPKPSLIDSNINSAIMAMLDIVQPKNDDTDELSWKCQHFRVRQKLLLKTSLRVFPTRRPNTRTCRQHHAVSGFFLCVVLCVMLSIVDMSIRAVEMS